MVGVTAVTMACQESQHFRTSPVSELASQSYGQPVFNPVWDEKGRRNDMTKEMYVQPLVTKHELLRDITAKRSGSGGPSVGGGGGGMGGGRLYHHYNQFGHRPR